MIFKKVFVHPKYPENLGKLYRLAYNLWWTWNYEAIKLFYRVDAHLFRLADHNPVRLLMNLPKEKIEALSRDKGFLFELEKVWQKFEEYAKYTSKLGRERDVVVFISMEFGIHESIPI